MGGVELNFTNDNRRLPPVVLESHCPLCTVTFREPFSASCKHPSCKSCLAVLFTRNLPQIDKVPCPTCNCQLKLSELKPDQSAQRKLQKIKSCKCKNCSWKGSYNDYIQNHERSCGGGARIQCKVLGCGKWLPEERALDIHRTDEWCPMILLMKTRLNHAEIVHLISTRVTWDWTCGLVLRSDKSSVRSLIERLVLVFSVLDPKVPITADRQSLDEILLSADCIAGASHAGEAPYGFVGTPQKNDPESFDDKELRGAAHDKEYRKTVSRNIRRVDEEIRKVKRDIDGLLKMMPKDFAVIHEKQELFQRVLATLDKDIMVVRGTLDRLKLTDEGVLDKLKKKYQVLEKSHAFHLQYGQKLDERLVDLEISHSGVYLWKIENYNERKRDAINTNIKSQYSPPFFTSQCGYKLCGRVFLMGEGVGKGTHISLFLTIMKGPHDAVLPWPFKERIIFQLVNQDDPVNKSIVEAFRPDPASSSFKKPTSEKNIGAGCPLFAKIQMIEDPKSGFVRDNTIYLKIICKQKLAER